MNSSNTLNFPEAINASVYCTNGSGWTVNNQSISSGSTCTFTSITSLVLKRAYTGSSETTATSSTTIQVTIN